MEEENGSAPSSSTSFNAAQSLVMNIQTMEEEEVDGIFQMDGEVAYHHHGINLLDISNSNSNSNANGCRDSNSDGSRKGVRQQWKNGDGDCEQHGNGNPASDSCNRNSYQVLDPSAATATATEGIQGIEGIEGVEEGEEGEEDGGKDWATGGEREEKIASEIGGTGIELETLVRRERETRARENEMTRGKREREKGYENTVESREGRDAELGGELAPLRICTAQVSNEGWLPTGIPLGADFADLLAFREGSAVWVKRRGNFLPCIISDPKYGKAADIKTKPIYSNKEYYFVYFLCNSTFKWIDASNIFPISDNPEPLAFGTHDFGRRLASFSQVPKKYSLLKLAGDVCDLSDRLHIGSVVESAQVLSFWKGFMKKAIDVNEISEVGQLLIELYELIIGKYVTLSFRQSRSRAWKSECTNATSVSMVEKLIKELTNAILWKEVQKLWESPNQPKIPPDWLIWKNPLQEALKDISFVEECKARSDKNQRKTFSNINGMLEQSQECMIGPEEHRFLQSSKSNVGSGDYMNLHLRNPNSLQPMVYLEDAVSTQDRMRIRDECNAPNGTEKVEERGEELYQALNSDIYMQNIKAKQKMGIGEANTERGSTTSWVSTSPYSETGTSNLSTSLFHPTHSSITNMAWNDKGECSLNSTENQFAVNKEECKTAGLVDSEINLTNLWNPALNMYPLHSSSKSAIVKEGAGVDSENSKLFFSNDVTDDTCAASNTGEDTIKCTARRVPDSMFCDIHTNFFNQSLETFNLTGNESEMYTKNLETKIDELMERNDQVETGMEERDEKANEIERNLVVGDVKYDMILLDEAELFPDEPKLTETGNDEYSDRNPSVFASPNLIENPSQSMIQDKYCVFFKPTESGEKSRCRLLKKSGKLYCGRHAKFRNRKTKEKANQNVEYDSKNNKEEERRRRENEYLKLNDGICIAICITKNRRCTFSRKDDSVYCAKHQCFLPSGKQGRKQLTEKNVSVKVEERDQNEKIPYLSKEETFMSFLNRIGESILKHCDISSEESAYNLSQAKSILINFREEFLNGFHPDRQVLSDSVSSQWLFRSQLLDSVVASSSRNPEVTKWLFVLVTQLLNLLLPCVESAESIAADKGWNSEKTLGEKDGSRQKDEAGEGERDRNVVDQKPSFWHHFMSSKNEDERKTRRRFERVDYNLNKLELKASGPNFHASSQKSYPSNSHNQTYKCKLCKKYFDNHSVLVKHYAVAHKQLESYQLRNSVPSSPSLSSSTGIPPTVVTTSPSTSHYLSDNPFPISMEQMTEWKDEKNSLKDRAGLDAKERFKRECQCRTCGEIFQALPDLERHLRIFHRDKSLSTSISMSTASKRKRKKENWKQTMRITRSRSSVGDLKKENSDEEKEQEEEGEEQEEPEDLGEDEEKLKHSEKEKKISVHNHDNQRLEIPVSFITDDGDDLCLSNQLWYGEDMDVVIKNDNGKFKLNDFWIPYEIHREEKDSHDTGKTHEFEIPTACEIQCDENSHGKALTVIDSVKFSALDSDPQERCTLDPGDKLKQAQTFPTYSELPLFDSTSDYLVNHSKRMKLNVSRSHAPRIPEDVKTEHSVEVDIDGFQVLKRVSNFEKNIVEQSSVKMDTEAPVADIPPAFDKGRRITDYNDVPSSFIHNPITNNHPINTVTAHISNLCTDVINNVTMPTSSTVNDSTENDTYQVADVVMKKIGDMKAEGEEFINVLTKLVHLDELGSWNSSWENRFPRRKKMVKTTSSQTNLVDEHKTFSNMSLPTSIDNEDGDDNSFKLKYLKSMIKNGKAIILDDVSFGKESIPIPCVIDEDVLNQLFIVDFCMVKEDRNGEGMHGNNGVDETSLIAKQEKRQQEKVGVEMNDTVRIEIGKETMNVWKNDDEPQYNTFQAYTPGNESLNQSQIHNQFGIMGLQEPVNAFAKDNNVQEEKPTVGEDVLLNIEDLLHEDNPKDNFVFMESNANVDCDTKMEGNHDQTGEEMEIKKRPVVQPDFFPTFQYITKRKLHSSLEFNAQHSQIGCQCLEDECNPAHCTHVFLFLDDNPTAVDLYGKSMANRFPYDKNGRIILEENYLVYECNVQCHCSESCQNRILQKGVKVQLEIFRTINKGWAVRAAEKILRGTFICEYIGEVVDDEEANTRGQKYDKVGRSYLYDIDAHIDRDLRSNDLKPFVIDATCYGNVARFINHSCDPNLINYQVLIESMDYQLAHIGLFAARDIMEGEELVYDYRYQLLPGKGCPCRCGASKCRGRLY